MLERTNTKLICGTAQILAGGIWCESEGVESLQSSCSTCFSGRTRRSRLPRLLQNLVCVCGVGCSKSARQTWGDVYPAASSGPVTVEEAGARILETGSRQEAVQPGWGWGSSVVSHRAMVKRDGHFYPPPATQHPPTACVSL
ncbi:hypothetical protein GJAV_G00271430 [Gymnothorax javanicus]|nr:hypothetical protein GJAV_G00271430 [Gymnothorax javanicus]